MRSKTGIDFVGLRNVLLGVLALYVVSASMSLLIAGNSAVSNSTNYTLNGTPP